MRSMTSPERRSQKVGETLKTAPDVSAVLGVECSVRGRRWAPREADERAALALSQTLGVPEIVGRVAAGRGISIETAADYLNPTLKTMMPDPSVMADVDAAAKCLAEAVQAGKTIGLFGDYDVDGATSSALMRLYLEAAGARVLVHIPDRQKEGYGPNQPAMEQLFRDGASVVVTLDCGIAAHEVLGACHNAGHDVIVVDHHLAEPALPPAAAIVNPNRLDDESGLGQLAAVGVAFMVLVAVNRTLRQAGYFGDREEPNLLRWLDIVALGTVCDVVPLTGLNRALVVQGLRVLAKRGNVGLAALADVCKLDSRPDAYHLGFVLGPRINAGGRVGEAGLGHKLLTASDPTVARDVAERLDRHNKERQAIEAMVVESAMESAEALRNDPIIIVDGERWHPGVIGLAASRLADRYDRPSLVIGMDDDMGKGSARSVPGFDIGALVTAARQAGHLANGGGHAMAAGLSVAREKLDALKSFLLERAKRTGPEGGVPTLKLDGIVSSMGANAGLMDVLSKAGPFGSGNPEPRFGFPAMKIVRADRVGDSHVRCVFAGSGSRLTGIAFRVADEPLGRLLLGARGAPVHIAANLRPDRWKGNGVQLNILDAAEADKTVPVPS